MSEKPEHSAPKRSRRVLKIVLASVVTIVLVVAAGGFLVYRHLNQNITAISMPPGALGTNRPTEVVKKNAPHKPENILLLGSDTRQGQSGHIGGETPGLSDTTILLHVSADRKLAYGVSIPRDTMVERPSCRRKGAGNGVNTGGLTQFNDAYAVGGPLCTVKTVESITDIHINHFVVIDFNGFRQMVNALGGVPVCVPTAVNDTTGHISLPAGTYTVKGQQALDYVRVRHDLGVENGDIGRMKRQQTFLASMANKVASSGTLFNPVRLYRFLDAATKSISTDPGLASVRKLSELIDSVRGIGLDHVQFLTVPFELYPPDHNRLQLAPSARRLWYRIRNDLPVNKALSGEVTTAATKNGKPAGEKTKGKHKKTSTTSSAAETAAQNGLCS